jgi:hypothetical protein
MNKELTVVSPELQNANLSKNDLTVVMTAVKYDLACRLNDSRKQNVSGVFDGIIYALRSQKRDDLVDLIRVESMHHSSFEIR